MSELTPCNYCTYKGIKERCKKEGKKVKLVSSKEIPGWRAVKIEGKEVAWFMEITNHCVC